MSAASIAVDVLLGVTTLSCWVGAVGIIRMRDPYQALHYLGVPATIGMSALMIAVFVQTGWSSAGWKCAIILIVFIAANSVGTHAAARAFRQREKRHWEPRPEDVEVEWMEGGQKQ